MERLITVYWRDIPSRVVGRRGHRSVLKRTLDPRFDQAIERAALRAGSGSSRKYLEDWRRESRPCARDLDREVAAEVARLEAEFPPAILEQIVRAAGIARSGPDAEV